MSTSLSPQSASLLMLDSVQLSGPASLVANATTQGGLEHCVSGPTALAADSARPVSCNVDKLGCSLASDTESLLHRVPPTPVPKLQLATLCLARLADPVTYTQVFPYVNEMIQDLAIASTPSQVGFYSGVVESVFAVTQLLTILPFSRLSDMIGRRPVILVGVVGLALATLVFGLSKTFVIILVARSLAGALAGNVAAIHAYLAEITDESNQDIALPAYGLCWPIGSIIGSLIGGTFSHPANHFLMFDIPLLRMYPYFLPCFFSSAIALGGAVLVYFCLDETLPNKRCALLDQRLSPNCIDTKGYGTINRTNAHQINLRVHDADSGHLMTLETESDVSMLALLDIPVVRTLAMSSLALSFLSGAFDVVFVLFCYSPITSGGLGFSATQIGFALATAGASATLLQLLVLPTLLRRVAVTTTYKFCMKLWPVAYLALPLLNFVARAGLETQNNPNHVEVLKPSHAVIVWIGIGLCLALTRTANLAFSLSMILVKNTSPSRNALGAANGLAQFFMCVARAIAPAFVSALFATSVNNHVLGSYFWVCVMVLFSWAGIRATDRINIS